MKTTIRFFALIIFTLAINSFAFGQDTTLTVTSDGKVGIGTTSPGEKLDVAGNIRMRGGHLITNAPNGALVLNAGPPNANNVAGIWFRKAVTLGEQGTSVELMRITDTGLIGIGTTSPSRKLHVDGTANIIATFSTTATGGGISFQDNTTSADNAVTIRATGEDLGFRTGSGGNFTFKPNGVEKVRITSAGNVGIGTTGPASALHIQKSDNTAIAQFDNTNAAGYGVLINTSGNTTTGEYALDVRSGSTSRFKVTTDGNVGIGITTPSHPLEMASGAHVTAGGVWTDASSRALKENIRDLTGDEAARALSQLAPKRYNYKADKSEEYLGFIAEDVPELVATGNRKSLSPMDIVAVLTRVVQAQQQTIMQLKHEMTSLKHQIQK